MSVGVVAALMAEARTLGVSTRRGEGVSATRDGTLVAVSGIGGPAAAAAAVLLADAGAGALVSWGLAGGLDPRLSAGTVCLPQIVVRTDGTTFTTDADWRELVGAAIAPRWVVVRGKLFTSERTIDDVAGKAMAFRDSGAAAVDMESAAVAEVAAARGLPFIAVRVIVDTAADALPAAVLTATRDGQVRIIPLLLGLARSPPELAALLRLARRYRAATRVLIEVARTRALAPLALAAAAANRTT